MYNDDNNILYFEHSYDTIMSDEEKKKAYLFYTELNNKNDIHFDYFTECSTTYGYDDNKFVKMWFHMSLNIFLENFNV